MEIVIGKMVGFCYGVERAVEGAIKEITTTKNKVYSLGEIVHNQQVVKKLEDLGIKSINRIEEAEGTVLIRAHGIPKEIYEIANKMNIKIKDFTCPNVLKIHKIVDKFSQDGYFIFLLGKKKHPENVGTLSHCGENYYIFEKEEELFQALESFRKTKKKKLLLISQTTYSLEQFYKIQEKLQKVIKEDTELVIKNTICKTTELRQKETKALSKKMEAMIIIGSKNSSNTKKLYKTAKKYCEATFFIENVEELQIQENIKKVGIVAGASTPKESIEEVIKYLKRRFQ